MDVPQVAVFDTAFHQTLPPHSFHYALPYEFYTEHSVRRYGFHGTSHFYVAKVAARHLGKPLEDVNLITLHLGNGASAAAIQNGKCIDTSMGLTPLEGLIMGTRCGDIDPAIHFYLMRQTGMSADEIEKLLNSKSGLKGICGVNDMRQIQQKAESGDERAMLALDMFCYRIRKYIGAYRAVINRTDAIVFTGGIGENSPIVRERACSGLDNLGISLDPQKNKAVSGTISEIQEDGSAIKVMVVATDEELEIAHQTIETIKTIRHSTI
jgi:acetate kinase